jgi:ABC-type polysaccharide/polyol phosphate export permease
MAFSENVRNEADERPSVARDLREIVSDLARYRELLYQLTLRDIRLKYKQAVMGFGWAVFMPVLIVLAGVAVRYAMGAFTGSAVNAHDLAGIAVKSLPWAFYVGAVTFATPSLTTNPTLVTKVYFAREVFPLSAVLAQTFDSAIGAVVVTIMLFILGIVPGVTALWVPLLALVLFVMTSAVAILLSCANLFFRDVKYIVQVLITFGIFATPVFFEPSMFGPRGATLLMANPLAPILEGLRLSLVEGQNLAATITTSTPRGTVTVWTPWYLAYASMFAVTASFAGSILFHRLEYVFAEKV